MATKKKELPSDPVDRIIASIQAGFGTGSAQKLGDDGAASEVTEVVPCGIGPVDHYVLGIGGFPVGRITEVFSEEGGGKTSICEAAIAGAQREGGVGMWAETEAAVSRSRFAVFGAAIERVILLQPQSVEEVGKMIETSLEAMPDGIGPNILVWDSIAATPTQAEIDSGLVEYKDRVGVRSKALSLMCRLLVPLAARKRTALVFINQVRANIGVMFGDKYTTPGGMAVKFHASIRVQILGGKAVKGVAAQASDSTPGFGGDEAEPAEEDTGGMVEHTGKIVTFLSAKNRLAPPWRKCRVKLDYATGWDDQWSTINYAKERGLISKSAAYNADNYEQAIKDLKWTKDK